MELFALAPEKIDPSFTGKFRAIFKTELEICAACKLHQIGLSSSDAEFPRNFMKFHSVVLIDV